MSRAIIAAMLATGAIAAQPPSAPSGASGELRKADGTEAGSAHIVQRGDQLVVVADAHGLTPGRYGAHIHAVGRCEAPAFESAGPHWNPSARQHGRLNPAGHHLGDLPNLDIGANGSGRIEFTIPGATLAGLLDADGASVVIHAAADDEHTDPSGNSGARVACGVLR
jgi:Cu-Zn family superoxide dismutase